MKKNFVLFMCMLAALSLPVLFTSCSDDDDDDNGGSGGGSNSSPTSDVSVITTNSGSQLLLTSIGNMLLFDYDYTGRLTYAQLNGYEYEISYNPYKITDNYNSAVTVSFNSKGYVTKFVDTDNFSTDTANFTYDGSGHLTKVTDTYVESGETKYSVTANYTWSNGDMTKAAISHGIITETYEYEYGSTANTYCQPTVALLESYFAGNYACYRFGAIGYFGVGTSHFPTSYAHTDTDFDTWRYTLTYTKNSDGTISSEKSVNTTYYDDTSYYAYSYSSL